MGHDSMGSFKEHTENRAFFLAENRGSCGSGPTTSPKAAWDDARMLGQLDKRKNINLIQYNSQK
jgi:hypothetical protein